MNRDYWTIFGLFGASLAGMLALTPLARQLAARVGLMDAPDGRRKIHPAPVPVAGGLAILVTSLAVLALALGLFEPVRELFAPSAGPMLGLLLGTLLICAVGVADDRTRMRGRHKVLGQLAAVGIVIACGVRVDAVHLFGWRVDLGVGAYLFTAFWLLGAINSLNLIDGMDGLLGSVGTIICLGVAVMSAWVGHWPEACVAAVLAGALTGFLCYNLPPASIFLGDAGSMVIGLVVGTLAIRSSLKGPATVALAAPTALLIIPIFDTTAAILRRKLTGRSIFNTDRGHLHHVLLDSGLSRPMVLLLVSGLCVLAIAGGITSVAYQSEALALISAAAVVAILVATRLFGHVELVLVLKHCGALARAVAGRGPSDGHEVQVRLQGSPVGVRRPAEPAQPGAGRQRPGAARGLPRPLGAPRRPAGGGRGRRVVGRPAADRQRQGGRPGRPVGLQRRRGGLAQDGGRRRGGRADRPGAGAVEQPAGQGRRSGVGHQHPGGRAAGAGPGPGRALADRLTRSRDPLWGGVPA
jgi:UDP-GlcNAc:undecaprenyl-phosphate GlcNAc-1-phosphate transferase